MIRFLHFSLTTRQQLFLLSMTLCRYVFFASIFFLYLNKIECMMFSSNGKPFGYSLLSLLYFKTNCSSLQFRNNVKFFVLNLDQWLNLGQKGPQIRAIKFCNHSLIHLKNFSNLVSYKRTYCYFFDDFTINRNLN